MHNWVLALVAVVSGVMLVLPSITGGAARGGIAIADAVHKMNREKAILIDVRDAAEYSQQHVAQSKHIPLAQLGEKLPSVVKKKETPVLFLCEKGMRANQAAEAAKKLGYDNAFAVTGGLKAWRDANMPLSGTNA